MKVLSFYASRKLESLLFPRCLYCLKTRNVSATHYETLGIKDTATQDEIRAAFHKLSKKYHPDLNHNSTDSNKKYSEITAAYLVLSKPLEKRQYDSELTAAKNLEKRLKERRYENRQYTYHTPGEFYDYEETEQKRYNEWKKQQMAVKEKQDPNTWEKLYTSSSESLARWFFTRIGICFIFVFMFTIPYRRNAKERMLAQHGEYIRKRQEIFEQQMRLAERSIARKEQMKLENLSNSTSPVK